jgi:hypothetical protein
MKKEERLSKNGNPNRTGAKKVKTDVLVAGGGTAGFLAAIAAARNGAKVIIVEPESYLGGTATGALVRGIWTLRHAPITNLPDMTSRTSDYTGEQYVLGLAQEYLDRLIEARSAWGVPGKAAIVQIFDPELAKWVIEKMVTEAGVEVWLYSRVVEVLKEENRIVGAVVDNSLGKIEVEANVIIDATGDGWVAVYAGADFEMGRSSDGLCQALSLFFTIAGVNINAVLEYLAKNEEEFGREYVNRVIKLRKEEKPLRFYSFKSKMREAIKNGDFPIGYRADDVNPDKYFLQVDPIFKNGKVRYDVMAFNTDMAYRVDATDPLDLSKALISMRDFAVKMASFYRKYIPGFEDSYLDQTASKPGIRETRRIIGDYILTGEDVQIGKSFPDAIGRCGGNADAHNEDGGKEAIKVVEVGGEGWYHIPYRILLPRGIENLLVVGRCVSSDRLANASVRGQGACLVMGQAAGTAAALSVKESVTPRAIDVKNLQKVLSSQGVLIWE